MVLTGDNTTQRCKGCGEVDVDLPRRESYCTECQLECERCGDPNNVLRELPSGERICYWCHTDSEERGGHYVQAPDGARVEGSA